jgi:heme-degrading monooxygenase HmoA
MVLEVAILDIKSGQQADFEIAFNQAQKIIMDASGYISHQLQKCVEKDNRYILLVNWENISHHTQVFRQSAQYKKWCSLLHHFYHPLPQVEHYELVCANNNSKKTIGMN